MVILTHLASVLALFFVAVRFGPGGLSLDGSPTAGDLAPGDSLPALPAARAQCCCSEDWTEARGPWLLQSPRLARHESPSSTASSRATP